ncbi:para-aminobenzoate synthetase component 1 [Prauserella isguenensis]|uniref:Para-aminobenzoate synthetase component 1 n=1 Tax=Prauserella isguenensis TaxID=1470180 RepID=A0A839RZP4_9PSEU|nr:aminodeoxychorismate synthase component I [Prauserella isguenensis]MBB3050524.1 para-aminobenzoate synthetase component 1 [Prauserella isguenensis]
MRLRRTALDCDLSPEQVLTVLSHRARERGLAGPAALTGDWFGSRAVVAPSVRIEPVNGLADALAAPSDLPAGTDGSDIIVDADVPPHAVGGGWFGYLSYDLSDPSRRRGPLPPAVWGWAGHVLRLDTDGCWWFEALDGTPGGDVDAAEFRDLLTPGTVGTEPAHTWRATSLDRPPRADHEHAVTECVRAIGAGEVFQANICTRFTGTFDGSPLALFTEGTRRLHPARAAYLSGDWGAAVSMSPELFVARHAATVRSTPIKGTRPRRGPQDDAGARLLRESVKDVAENVMITDLVRNDLGRVCETGSVRVPELLAVRPAPGVWHLDSTVVGTLPTGTGDTELLRAAFPPGSVTGAPKIRALDLIAELEPVPRGLYTGAVGLASPVAGTELNVAIRTFEIAGGEVHVGVGGGITADSDPRAEWNECLDKAAPLETLLASPPDVLADDQAPRQSARAATTAS